MALYDISKNFLYNCENGPFFEGKIPHRLVPPKNQWKTFLGYKIASPIGMPACPVGTSKGIALAAQLGFDVLTYKTFRSTPFSGHTFPNICFVDCKDQLTNDDLDSPYCSLEYNDSQNITISNSFGNVCPDPDWMQQDISRARASIFEGQLLICSVYGTKQEDRSLIQDFVYTGLLAQEAGAQIIEANFSCPNLDKIVYKNPEMVYEITKQMARALTIPLIIKVGLFDSLAQHKSVFLAACHGGAQGITGLNTIPMQIIKRDNKPYFGSNRTVSGVSGSSIRSLAQNFVRNSIEVIKKEALPLKILATGGVTQPEHFEEFLNLGATIAMSATGMMWNPYLACQYHTRHDYKKPVARFAQAF